MVLSDHRPQLHEHVARMLIDAMQEWQQLGRRYTTQYMLWRKPYTGRRHQRREGDLDVMQKMFHYT